MGTGPERRSGPDADPGERATVLEPPHENPDGRATGELTALVGARVEVTPGERLAHMPETLIASRASAGQTKGMPSSSALARLSRDLSAAFTHVLAPR